MAVGERGIQIEVDREGKLQGDSRATAVRVDEVQMKDSSTLSRNTVKRCRLGR